MRTSLRNQGSEGLGPATLRYAHMFWMPRSRRHREDFVAALAKSAEELPESFDYACRKREARQKNGAKTLMKLGPADEFGCALWYEING